MGLQERGAEQRSWPAPLGGVRPILVVLTSVALLLLLPFIEALGDEQREAYDREKERLQEIEAEIVHHREMLDGARQREKTILEKLEDTDHLVFEKEGERAVVEGRIRDLKAELSRLDEELEAARSELDAIERESRKARDLFNNRLRSMYKYGRTLYLEFLVDVQSWGELVSRLYYIHSLVDHDAQVLTMMEEQLVRMEAQEARITRREQAMENSLQELVALREELQERERLLERQREERMAFLAEIEREKASYEQSLRELEEVSEQIASYIAKLHEEKEREGRADDPGQQRGEWEVTSKRDPPGSGVMKWPTDSRRVTSGYGWRNHPIHGARSFHDGIDIAADHGDPIYAAEAGRVIYSGWAQGYGKTVIIDHGEGISSLSAHASEILVPPGGYVERGQVIARVGTTGFSTGPHLHFEVRELGRPVDPGPYLGH